jgi:very-short-patch-repair endonuclease
MIKHHSTKTYTTEEFIIKAKKIHGNTYNYSKVNYINNRIKITIICPKHGEFIQTPKHHLNGCNCPLCTNNNIKLTTEQFILKAKEIHGNKYDYSKVDYVNSNNKVTIICHIHGEFTQTPYNHKDNKGCPKCIGRNKTTEEIITLANEIHGNKYDYSKLIFLSSKKKVTIICHKHGEFKQTTKNHINNKQGCPKCSVTAKLTTELFIDKAKLIHYNTYDYSMVNYVNSRKNVIIICQSHGKFKQQPTCHLNGNGCPICKESKGELMIRNILNTKQINFFRNKKFPNCKFKKPLSFDFYLPNHNVCIEFDGIQHHNPIKYFGGENTFKKIQIRDNIKTQYCINNNIKLIRIPYTDINNVHNILNQFIT